MLGIQDWPRSVWTWGISDQLCHQVAASKTAAYLYKQDCLGWRLSHVVFCKRKTQADVWKAFFCMQHRSAGLCHQEFHNIYRLLDTCLKSQMKLCPFDLGLNTPMQPQGLSWSSEAQHQRADWRRTHWGGVQLGRKWSQETQSYSGGDGRHAEISGFGHWKKNFSWKTTAGWNTSLFLPRVSTPSLCQSS